MEMDKWAILAILLGWFLCGEHAIRLTVRYTIKDWQECQEFRLRFYCCGPILLGIVWCMEWLPLTWRLVKAISNDIKDFIQRKPPTNETSSKDQSK